MNLDLKLLSKRFSQAAAGEPVSTEEVNPYLLEYLIRPLLRGARVCYGDIDYDEFEDIDLRVASGYCDDLCAVSYKMEQFVGDIANVAPAAHRARAFC